MPNPTRVVHRPRDVTREVSQLHPTGFEGYVADRFANRAGWRADTTPRSRDQGADVLVTSPRGVRYLVQCKLVTSSLGSPDAQRTGGAASFNAQLRGVCLNSSQAFDHGRASIRSNPETRAVHA
jgi:HJR/Mrr/RecB family endonuclease